MKLIEPFIISGEPGDRTMVEDFLFLFTRILILNQIAENRSQLLVLYYFRDTPNLRWIKFLNPYDMLYSNVHRETLRLSGPRYPQQPPGLPQQPRSRKKKKQILLPRIPLADNAISTITQAPPRDSLARRLATISFIISRSWMICSFFSLMKRFRGGRP